MLTKTQRNRLQKSMKNGIGSDIKISKTQIRKAVKQGGAPWSSLFTKLLPMATSLASKAASPLPTGAFSGLASLGVDKIFGRGKQVAGFLIPQHKVDQLIKYKDWLTNEQKKQIVNAIHTGGQIVSKPTKSQSGGFLGTLLASIGVPLLLNALTGKGLRSKLPKANPQGLGLQVDRERCQDGLYQFMFRKIPIVETVFYKGDVQNISPAATSVTCQCSIPRFICILCNPLNCKTSNLRWEEISRAA